MRVTVFNPNLESLNSTLIYRNKLLLMVSFSVLNIVSVYFLSVDLLVFYSMILIKTSKISNSLKGYSSRNNSIILLALYLTDLLFRIFMMCDSSILWDYGLYVVLSIITSFIYRVLLGLRDYNFIKLLELVFIGLLLGLLTTLFLFNLVIVIIGCEISFTSTLRSILMLSLGDGVLLAVLNFKLLFQYIGVQILVFIFSHIVVNVLDTLGILNLGMLITKLKSRS